MNGDEKIKSAQKLNEPQCQFFVQRKKRLCRMTVKPGRNFCGEHESAPPDAGEQDLRVPCPLDPKHTCYASKIEKHLQVCNSRRGALPEYYEHNVNAAEGEEEAAPVRLPLPQVPRHQLDRVIEKINCLYESVVEHEISPLPEAEPAIHPAVLSEFSLQERTESSRRHLRQASALLRLCEDEGLAEDNTCYVELGAGKGHLSYFAWLAWCSRQPSSRALLLDRAALRHKRDNKLRGATLADGGAAPPSSETTSLSESGDIPSVSRNQSASGFTLPAPVRLRADLAHVALQRVPCVAECQRVVGLAKHLCGVATDYALRCMTAGQVVHKTRGLVVATCCHHRCERAAYIAAGDLLELGISGEELDVVLGVVSWATCGDGRSRAQRLAQPCDGEGRLTHSQREEVGRRAKALVDWGRVRALRRLGFRARLARFVPHAVSPENIAIVAGQDLP